MADEPMNLPGGPERNTAIVVKDPTKPNFWRFRNIALLFMTATLPALTGRVPPSPAHAGEGGER